MIKRYMPSGGDAPWNPWKKDTGAHVGPTRAKAGKKKRVVKGEGRRRQVGGVVGGEGMVMEYEVQGVTLGSSVEEEREVEEKPRIPESTAKYGDVCLLHSVGKGDTLTLVALRYKTTEGIIQELNQLRQGDDLDTLPMGSLIVIPINSTPEVLEECYLLNTKPEFLEMYGSRLSPTFRRKRAPPTIHQHHIPSSVSAPASFFDQLEEENNVYDYSPSYENKDEVHIPTMPAGGGSQGAAQRRSTSAGQATKASVSKIASSIKNIFSQQKKTYSRLMQTERKDQ
eukprot:TRINITY_DN20905_c0_g1_i1.p1 TRINITY_DN20905_c0_g1~~TRINITY_DN20905_c0_g1_i1.p1  ORF type:complete len:300 (+),score=59.36 TRINITY_DN20905_c0_g1_i1:54-902(+)